MESALFFNSITGIIFDGNLVERNFGVIEKTGSLTDGFELVINDGDRTPVLIGDPLFVEGIIYRILPISDNH